MSNIRPKIIVFFVILTLILNININAYANKELTKKQEYSINIKPELGYKYDLKKAEQGNLIRNYESDDSIIYKQITDGYISSLVYFLVGVLLSSITTFISFSILNFTNKQSLHNDYLVLYISTAVIYITINLGIAKTVYDIGENKWEGNYELTFISGLFASVLYTGVMFFIEFLSTQNLKENRYSEHYSKNFFFYLFYVLLYPLYLSISNTVGYHLTKKDKRIESNQILLNTKEQLAKIEELKNFTKKIIINDNNISFQVVKF